MHIDCDARHAMQLTIIGKLKQQFPEWIKVDEQRPNRCAFIRHARRGVTGPDEDPLMLQEPEQLARDADGRQEPTSQELVVNTNDLCEIVLKSGARKGLACGRQQPCRHHRYQG